MISLSELVVVESSDGEWSQLAPSLGDGWK